MLLKVYIRINKESIYNRSIYYLKSTLQISLNYKHKNIYILNEFNSAKFSYSESIEFIYKKEEMQIDIRFVMDQMSLKNCY